MTDKPKYKVSATRLKTWLECPEAFRLAQDVESKGRERGQSSPNLAAQRGTLIHAALEEAALDIASTTEAGTITGAAAMAKLGEVAAKLGGFAEEAITEAAELLQNMRPRPLGRVLGVERNIRARFSEDESIPPLVFTVDLVAEQVDKHGTTLRLIDWKSSARATDKITASADPQVVLYLAGAVRAMRAGNDALPSLDQVDSIRFELIYPAINRRTIVEWSPEIDAYAEALWLHAAPRASRGEGEAKLGGLCRWCASRWHCEAFGAAAATDFQDVQARIGLELASLTDSDLVTITEEVKALANASKRAADDLSAELLRRIHEGESEAFEAAGRRAKIVTMRKRFLKGSGFLDFAEELGLEPLEVVRAVDPDIALGKLEPLLDETQRAALGPYTGSRISQYVSFSKAKPPKPAKIERPKTDG